MGHILKMQSNLVYMIQACYQAALSLWTCCYDSNSRMSFEEPNDPRSSQIVKWSKIKPNPANGVNDVQRMGPALGQVTFWVRDLRLKLDQSDVSKVTHVWHKKATTPVSLAPNERSIVQKKKKKCLAKIHNWVILQYLYNYMIYIIINTLQTSNFSLVFINHLF